MPSSRCRCGHWAACAALSRGCWLTCDRRTRPRGPASLVTTRGRPAWGLGSRAGRHSHTILITGTRAQVLFTRLFKKLKLRARVAPPGSGWPAGQQERDRVAIASAAAGRVRVAAPAAYRTAHRGPPKSVAATRSCERGGAACAARPQHSTPGYLERAQRDVRLPTAPAQTQQQSLQLRGQAAQLQLSRPTLRVPTPEVSASASASAKRARPSVLPAFSRSSHDALKERSLAYPSGVSIPLTAYFSERLLPIGRMGQTKRAQVRQEDSESSVKSLHL